MTIEVGSYVTKEKKSGVVVKIDGDNATWRQSNGMQRTDKISTLTEGTDMAARWAAYQPDAVELVANVAVFAGTQAVRKRKPAGEATMRFAVEDALYEFVGKKWLQENVESHLNDTARVALAGKEATARIVAFTKYQIP